MLLLVGYDAWMPLDTLQKENTHVNSRAMIANNTLHKIYPHTHVAVHSLLLYLNLKWEARFLLLVIPFCPFPIDDSVLIFFIGGAPRL